MLCFNGCHRCYFVRVILFFFFKQKTAYEMRISDWSSDVCSSDLPLVERDRGILALAHVEIEDREACGACRVLDRDRQRPRQAVAARPGRHEGGRQSDRQSVV